MKKITALLTAAVMTAALPASGALGTAAAAETGNSLVVLGDSIASGYGLEGYDAGANYSAPDSFANMLGDNFDLYYNYAVDGRTSGELLTALEDESIAAALADADTVVVSIGGNDFLQPMLAAVMNAAAENQDVFDLLSGLAEGSSKSEAAASGALSAISGDIEDYMDVLMELMTAMTDAADAVDISATVGNISGILGTISDLAPESQIEILTVYNPFEGVAGMEMFDALARTKLEELNSGIAAAAEENGSEVVDVNAAFAGHALEYTNISSVDIHPNKEGHAVIYQLLLDNTGADLNTPAGEAPAPGGTKGSPDTGVEGIALFAGIAALAGAAAAASRKRR